MEKIIRIEELNGAKRDGKSYGGYEGFRVITDKQSIEIGVSDARSCCESFGHISTPDDVKEFEGAYLLSISRVDEALKKYECLEYMDEGQAIFINLETSKGTLQLTVYNSHNGYYGHTAYVKSKQLNIEECL